MTSLIAIGRVWFRYFAVFKKNIFYASMTTFTEPILYLLSFGFGLGAVVGPITVGGVTVSYRAFVLAGIVAQTVLFQSFFEAAYGSFIRMYYQKIFHAIATTPVTISEVLWGELVWDATRATISASAVLLIGVVIGDFHPLGALALVPLSFLFSFIFAGLGLLTAAKSQTIETINYPQYLFVFPMFLFCGVFFPLTSFPVWARNVISLLPLTPIISLVRTLTLGFRFEPWDIALFMAWLGVLVPLSRRAMLARLRK